MNTKHIPTGLMILGAFVLAFSLMQKKQDKNSEIHSNTAKELLTTVQKNQNIQPAQNVDSLRNAYTGKWFKNNPVAQEAGIFQFSQPTNTRNVVETKKDADKKKAELKKKQASVNKMTMEMQQQQMRPMLIYMMPSLLVWIFVFPAIFGSTAGLSPIQIPWITCSPENVQLDQQLDADGQPKGACSIPGEIFLWGWFHGLRRLWTHRSRASRVL